jgi:hypothetical protein
MHYSVLIKQLNCRIICYVVKIIKKNNNFQLGVTCSYVTANESTK